MDLLFGSTNICLSYQFSWYGLYYMYWHVYVLKHLRLILICLWSKAVWILMAVLFANTIKDSESKKLWLDRISCCLYLFWCNLSMAYVSSWLCYGNTIGIKKPNFHYLLSGFNLVVIFFLWLVTSYHVLIICYKFFLNVLNLCQVEWCHSIMFLCT